jgi:hypothetical protein
MNRGARHSGRYGADDLSLRREKYYIAGLRRQARGGAASTDIRLMWHSTELASTLKVMATRYHVVISVGSSCLISLINLKSSPSGDGYAEGCPRSLQPFHMDNIHHTQPSLRQTMVLGSSFRPHWDSPSRCCSPGYESLYALPQILDMGKMIIPSLVHL